MALASVKNLARTWTLAVLLLSIATPLSANAQLEPGFISHCRNLWAKLLTRDAPIKRVARPTPAPRQPGAPRAIDRLQTFLDADRKSTFIPHELVMGPNGATLKIGYLERTQKRFMSLVIRAIEEGDLSNIEAGEVVGPKVLILLNRMRDLAIRSDKPLTIRGILSPAQLREKAFMQQSFGISERFQPDMPESWTQQEARDFKKAWKDLGIKKCDFPQAEDRIHLCQFEISVRDGKSTLVIKPY